MKHMLKPASCMFRTDHMLPQLHVSSCSHDAVMKASGFPLKLHTRKRHLLQLHRVAPKNDVPVPLWQEIYMTFMPSVLLCCRRIPLICPQS